MNLETLIYTLAEFDPAAPIRFDGGGNVGDLASWRGVYAELTLTHGREPKTVGEVLADARKAVGATFTGYKGGDYVMDGTTPVWADDYGDCHYNAISGFSAFRTINGPAVTIHTVNIGDYR